MINSLFRRPFRFSVSFVSSSLFPGVPSSNYHGDPSKSLQGFTLCFQLLFPSIGSSFYYRSSSWRLYMVVRQGFFSFFNCSSRFLLESRSVKLYFKINMVFNTCLVLRSSSFLHLAFRSAILSTLSFEVVLCHSWQFPFMLHDSQVVKNDILQNHRLLFDHELFQPILISSLELSCVIFHLKPSLRNIANYGAIYDPSFSPILSAKKFFISLVLSNQINGFH